MADPARARKVADRIKVIVAEMLEWRTKDERLGFVTVTDVKVTGDIQQASVFYTVLGGEEDRERTAAALEANKGRIRSAVGKGLGIRLTPSLSFHLDSIPEGAAHLDELLEVTQRRDAELAQAAEGASFAGDADPYRTSHEPAQADDTDTADADADTADTADADDAADTADTADADDAADADTDAGERE